MITNAIGTPAGVLRWYAGRCQDDIEETNRSIGHLTEALEKARADVVELEAKTVQLLAAADALEPAP